MISDLRLALIFFRFNAFRIQKIVGGMPTSCDFLINIASPEVYWHFRIFEFSRINNSYSNILLSYWERNKAFSGCQQASRNKEVETIGYTSINGNSGDKSSQSTSAKFEETWFASQHLILLKNEWKISFGFGSYEIPVLASVRRTGFGSYTCTPVNSTQLNSLFFL